MRVDVLNRFRLPLVRSAALVSVAALTAGCSADATRLQDGFYTGAIPKASVQQTQVAQVPTYGAGQPNASYGAGTTGSSQTYAAATPPVTRSNLPPPPAASYGDGGYSQPSSQVSQAPASRAPIGSSEIGQTGASRGMASAAPVQSASRTSAGRSITVTSGDSVLGLARRNGVSAAELRRANGLSDDNIRIGQTLVVPSGGTGSGEPTRVATLGAPPTTLQAQAKAIPAPRSAPPAPAAAAAAKPAPVLATVTAAKPTATAAAPAHTTPAVAAAPAPVEAAPKAPDASSSAVAAAAPAPATTVAEEEKQEQASIAPKSTGIDEFRWPVQGRVVKNFGDKVGSRRNDGLNISVPRGTPVKAAENGVVIYAGEGLKEFGKTVLIKHDNGLVTVYGHADDIMVQRGATVKRGQEIAKAGMTGDTDTPMLHFEVRKDSSPVNPMTYLR
ncbi:peptidoglycan DD-metalloendopeptidase family protein [Aureimonas sp. AU12]|uniref:peptidoglycan DD-metalloendopeptidase family protein n=1 Tax=Aureimonas sp. AU12 TaxID=1638161 RepID=UPI0009E97A66|nr:peptidoglycan DD-metalloendopeptidase family protein [Aureimonas sp. AU12]